MSNNIIQWNPAKNNQQDDSAYTSDSMRTGGAVPGIFTKELANKLFYQVTTMCSALGEMMSNKGYNISDADISVLITALSNILTKADFGTTANTVCQGNDSRFFASGTRCWFGNDTAPTGWTIDASAADALLAVKGGSNDYNIAGGTKAGTWTQPGHLHTTANHTLTVAEMPSHRHSSVGWAMISGYSGSGVGNTYDTYTGYEGGGQAHNHGDTTSSALPPTYRPLANVGIVAIKD